MADLTKGHLAWHEIPCPPLPLREVAGVGNKVPLVWCALTDIARARGRLCFRVRLRQLSAVTGIERRQTLSTALTVLNNAGWLLYSRKFNREEDDLTSEVTVRLVHGSNLPVPSKAYRQRIWQKLFNGLRNEQPDNVKAVMDMATYVWVWECTLQLAYPVSLIDEAQRVLLELPPARWYGLVPVPESERPGYALKLAKP